MKKRFVSIMLLTSMLAGIVTGCGKTDTSKYPNGKLYVYNWGAYIDEEVIDEFEE